MKIIDARWQTTEEKNNIEKYRCDLKKKETDFSIQYCSSNIQQIIKWYNEFEDVFTKRERQKNILKAQKLKEDAVKSEQVVNDVKQGKERLCQCGAKLRYIIGFNFVGCSNYLDKSKKHNTFNIPNWESINIYERTLLHGDIDIPENHLLRFRQNHPELKDIKLNILYKFLKSNNVDFIKPVNEKIFNGVVTDQRNSSTEEKIIREILTKKYSKVNYQQGIKYKTEESNVYKTCIPDYICQNDTSIIVFDAKKSIANINTTQLNLYHNVVEFIRDKHKSNKEVKSYFIIFEPFSDQINQCLTIKDLNEL